MAKKRKRYQRQFKFWLNALNRQDQKIIEDIDNLKTERSFTQAIREGLRLIPSLMRGETDVLFEMFPAIKDKLYAQMEADILEQLNVERSNEMIQHIIELKGVVSQFKNQPMLSTPIQGTLSMRRVTVEEDIELEVTQVEGAGLQASQNFLKSMMALNPVEQPKQIAQPKQLQVKQFDAPVFDDDDDDFLIVATGD